MKETDVLELLRATIARLGLEVVRPVTLDVDLRHDLGIDSVDFLDVLFEVNDRLGIDLTLERVVDSPEPTRMATLVGCILEALRRRETPVNGA